MAKLQKPNALKLINNNSFKFRSNFNLGSLEAESDQYLNEVFVDRSELAILIDTNSPGCVTIGRTGSGKTALLKQIENEGVKTIRIKPEDMALQYLSNSTILSYFEDLGVKLDLFYKTLWKHVFVVEFLKMYCVSEQKFDTIISNFLERITGRDHAKRAATEYLKKWKDTFWQNTEHRIKEMETILETRFAQELGVSGPSGIKEVLGVNAKFSNDQKESEKIKIDILHKAQSVMNEMQVQDITEIIRLMKIHLFDSKKEKYIIIIDDLDKEWIDRKNVYALIRAMLDAIKDLKEIEGTKIVIALRENLLKLVLNQANPRGIQREKYKSLLLELKWTKSELEELINNRLEQLMKHSYTNATPNIHDVLKGNTAVNNADFIFNYMVERTLMRPRDIIAYFNICIKNANGKPEITFDNVKNSEVEYSRDRLQAIVDEWRENYEQITDFLNLLKGSDEFFNLEEIAEKAEAYISSPVCNISNADGVIDPTLAKAITTYTEKMDVMPLLKQVMVYLFATGVIGVKLYTYTSYEYSYDSTINVDYGDISEKTKFCVHKAFHRSLNIKPANTRLNGR